MLRLAEPYLRRGWSVIPVRGKLPLFPWKEFTRRQIELDPSQWETATGVAGICGYNDMVCIDFDDPTTATGGASVLLDMLGLDDYPWLVHTPSGGLHVWVRCKVPNAKRPGRYAKLVELRAHDCYALLPGSRIGNIVYRRKSDEDCLPAQVSERWLMAAYHAITKASPPPPVETVPLKGTDELCKWLRTRSNGERNDSLFWAARHSDGSDESFQNLLAAALDIGLGEREAIATIRSGLKHRRF